MAGASLRNGPGSAHSPVIGQIERTLRIDPDGASVVLSDPLGHDSLSGCSLSPYHVPF